MTGSCPACGAPGARTVLEQGRVPVNSCLLLDSRAQAAAFPTGDIRLAHCRACGFLFNAAFDPALIEYSARYEETQGFSPRFREFQRDLARHWLERYDLTGKRVLEIGCGKGDFLVELCELGAGRSVGIDPSVAPDRQDSPAAGRITWLPAFYGEGSEPIRADAVVCRHTLEHIPDVGAFLRTVRRGIGDRSHVAVLFEVPDTLRVLHEGAFWDVYYEHCSYFTPGSLSRLFRAAGFEVLDLWRGFDDQYLIIEARPGPLAEGVPAPVVKAPHALEEDRRTLDAAVTAFASTYQRQVRRWRAELQDRHAAGERVVVWGAGSKAVAYLTALGLDGEVELAVDINPHKQGMFLAGSGRQVVAPAELASYRPDLVVVMNPVYLDEIRADVARLGMDADVVVV